MHVPCLRCVLVDVLLRDKHRIDEAVSRHATIMPEQVLQFTESISGQTPRKRRVNHLARTEMGARRTSRKA